MADNIENPDSNGTEEETNSNAFQDYINYRRGRSTYISRDAEGNVRGFMSDISIIRTPDYSLDDGQTVDKPNQDSLEG
ncbi:hypothetical protein KC678_04745 [Candidatus Dojkabacteria bacterium]|uniref:Uncharacterized protein n=1 Tax=Candidatus Dojkabacteria bacterium TaxID=2099670 RepID=A0A955L281_9BACT|nr:hypothetical protein [Candidatus Dojkabacteria bacterium]